jgi:RNA polymerase sigma-70 factor (ECF subfamily)
MKRTEQDFRDLFSANFPDLLAFTYRRCGSQQDAEDLTAETFAVAWRRMNDLPEGQDARLWLFGVARHLLLNRERTLRRQTSLGARLALFAFSMAQHQPTDAAAAGNEVLEALNDLNAKDREVITLHAWDGLSADEIGQVLDISTAAVWKRMQRARGRLTASLAQRSTHQGGTARTTVIKELP